MSSSTTVTLTQLRPLSRSSIFIRGVSTTPSRSTSPHLTCPTSSSPCFTITVAEGTAEISAYAESESVLSSWP